MDTTRLGKGFLSVRKLCSLSWFVDFPTIISWVNEMSKLLGVVLSRGTWRVCGKKMMLEMLGPVVLCSPGKGR